MKKMIIVLVLAFGFCLLSCAGTKIQVLGNHAKLYTVAGKEFYWVSIPQDSYDNREEMINNNYIHCQMKDIVYIDGKWWLICESGYCRQYYPNSNGWESARCPSN